MLKVTQLKELIDTLDMTREMVTFGIATYANTHQVTIYFEGDEYASVYNIPLLAEPVA